MFLPDHFLSQQHLCWDPPHKQRTSVLLLDLFLATPISSARASLQLPNTGIDPKLTEINRKHFCELQVRLVLQKGCFIFLASQKWNRWLFPAAVIVLLETWVFSWRHTFSAGWSTCQVRSGSAKFIIPAVFALWHLSVYIESRDFPVTSQKRIKKLTLFYVVLKRQNYWCASFSIDRATSLISCYLLWAG